MPKPYLHKPSNKQNTKIQASEIRVIAGTLRGRKIKVLDAENLRPTPSKTRETIFNWLQAEIPNSHCLDLFAGSGALGIEAISRGAQKCTFIELNRLALKNIQTHIDEFKIQAFAELHLQEAQAFLTACTLQFDVIFIDPPFNQTEIYQNLLTFISEKQLLNQNGSIICECDSNFRKQFIIPNSWLIHRETKAGQSTVLLLKPNDKN